MAADAEMERKMKQVTEAFQECEQLYMNKILRMRKSDDLTNDAFYKSSTNVWEDHIATRARVEGQQEISAVRFAPRRASLDWFESKRTNIMLYGVFIDCDEFLLEWCDLLMEGEVTEDLPAYLSRESLEQKQILKKCSEIFAGIAENQAADGQVGYTIESKREDALRCLHHGR